MADDEVLGITVQDLDEADTVVAGDVVMIHHSNGNTEKIDADKFGGKALRFSTMAAAQTALAIPAGSEGFIPDNAIVIVDEVNAYVMGEEQA